MSLSYINELSIFTNLKTNYKNHKTWEFSLKWPERL